MLSVLHLHIRINVILIILLQCRYLVGSCRYLGDNYLVVDATLKLTNFGYLSLISFGIQVLSWQLSDCGVCQYHLLIKSAILVANTIEPQFCSVVRLLRHRLANVPQVFPTIRYVDYASSMITSPNEMLLGRTRFYQEICLPSFAEIHIYVLGLAATFLKQSVVRMFLHTLAIRSHRVVLRISIV